MVVLWALRGKNQPYSVSEIFKSLIHQALNLDYTSHSDLAFSFQLRKFLDVRSEEEYVNLLDDILQHFSTVYIIVEAGVTTPCNASQFQHHLQELLRRFSDRGAKTVVKVIFLTYGPGPPPKQSKGHLIYKVGRSSRRKVEKLPDKPLAVKKSGSRQLMRRVGLRAGQQIQVPERAVRADAGRI